MSRDIRSFFITQKTQKPKLDDDSDVIPESPDVEIKVKKRATRKKRILSDSDEEIFATKKKKSDDESKKPSHKTLKSKSPAKKELKEVKAVDIFGKTPIKRTEPSLKKVEKKTETGIHSDDDFDQSLLELDDTEKTAECNTKKEIVLNKTKHDEKKSKVLLAKDIEANKSIDTKSSSDRDQNGSTALNQDGDIVSKKAKKRHNEESSSSQAVQKNQDKTSNLTETSNKLHKSKDGTAEPSNPKKPVSGSMSNKTISNPETSETKPIKKVNKSLNESVLSDEDRYERKRHSAVLYQNYLNRSGPKNLGAKEIPEGSPNCLKDCSFLLTGVLDSFEREEVVQAITKFGGTVKNSMSKKVTHVLAGDDAGPAKIAKAQELGTKILNENEFLELIINNTKASNNDTLKITNGNDNQKSDTQKTSKDKHVALNQNGNHSGFIHKESSKDTIKHNVKELKIEKVKNNDKHRTAEKDQKTLNLPAYSKLSTSPVKHTNDSNVEPNNKLNVNSPQSQMWVEKYKPQTLKQIIGQHGEASNVKKLCNWLTKWYVNRKAKLVKPSPWAKNDDGGYYKAALLSGPPGVGKTTTVSLVCKELGFDMVEFNASDTRSKSLIKEQISELLTTTSLSGYAKGCTGKQAVTKKHVLVMDEVDGMAGNEDRGGLQELISLIKSASVPIICMCNDRNSQKMRSLVNYCYDLRFNRPRVDQIKAAMMSVCCKEGVKVPGEVLGQLIVAANQDVRQTLNLLSMWAADERRDDLDRLRRDAAQTKKDIKLGPWEAIRKVFSAEEHKSMSIHDKSDLFFYDYSLAPLFVQENYLQVAPHCPKHEVLDRVSSAADSISAGDLVDARIRGNQAWSLLPLQAMYSSVIPGHALSGHVTGQIQFPSWLGKNSRRSKMQRLCQEIHAHTRLSTSGSKSSIFLDYCTHLRDAIVTPLVRDKSEGIARSLAVLESYHLLRDDLDSLTELAVWPGQRNPIILIDSKVKAAMTRTYNKTAMALPYAPGAVRRGRAAADADGDGDPADQDHDPDQDDDQEDSDPENDILIKKKKVKEPERSNSEKDSKPKPSTSKGKGKKK